ncbi:MAG: metal-dependent transcriptional regulator [Bacteroidetes bacterium]|nr:metal-dependent transcriptional regulator [Bacteroidota bacterium]MDA1122254.1 metal-dependent transcriptional regulator [Bacteroidota bacterium]
MNFSFAEENYIKTIYHLSQAGEVGVSTNAIADQLHTKPASVTDMIRKLANKEVVDYQKYQGVNISEQGKKVALEVIRKHRLWEVFLVEKLKFNWDEVHEIAEQLEHIRSSILTERLDEFLGYPKADPHGDPIPDKEGKFETGPTVALSEMSVDDIGLFVMVANDDPHLLQYLDKMKIKLGMKLKVIDKVVFDGSMQISFSNETPVFLSHQITQHLMIRKVA